MREKGGERERAREKIRERAYSFKKLSVSHNIR